MARTIHVRIITTDEQAITDDAVAVRAPGEVGDVGFLYNHAPLVTTIRPGKFLWRQPNGALRTITVGPGLLEITHNQLTLLTERIHDAQTVTSSS